MITFTSLQYLNGSCVVEGTGQTIFTLSVDIQPSSWSQDLTFATSLISYLLLVNSELKKNIQISKWELSEMA